MEASHGIEGIAVLISGEGGMSLSVVQQNDSSHRIFVGTSLGWVGQPATSDLNSEGLPREASSERDSAGSMGICGTYVRGDPGLKGGETSP